MEFSVEEKVFRHVAFVCFEGAVEIMDVYAGEKVGEVVEEAGGEPFQGRGVLLVFCLFPAVDEVVPFRDLCEETRDFFRVVLQVAVHRYDDLFGCFLEPDV